MPEIDFIRVMLEYLYEGSQLPSIIY
jgi:hypothetical protein